MRGKGGGGGGGGGRLTGDDGGISGLRGDSMLQRGGGVILAASAADLWMMSSVGSVDAPLTGRSKPDEGFSPAIRVWATEFPWWRSTGTKR